MFMHYQFSPLLPVILGPQLEQRQAAPHRLILLISGSLLPLLGSIDSQLNLEGLNLTNSMHS